MKDLWAGLAWDDLKSWAGERTLARGRSYRSAVEELSVADDGRLLAGVRGTRRYATVVGVAQGRGGKLALDSRCTCPVGISCKHAVAVVVAYLHALKHGQPVPAAAADDRRLAVLEKGRRDKDVERDDLNDDYDDEDGDDVWDAENEGRVEERGNEATQAPHRPAKAARTRENLQAFLENKSAPELVGMLKEIVARHSEERERLQEAADLSRGATARLVRAARRELESVTSEPAWTDQWRGGGSLPDYANLRRRFENLLAGGAADALVDLGRELLRSGTRQVEASHDDGMTAVEVGGCMEVVFRAVLASSLSDAGKVLFTVESLLEDEYDLCQGTERVLDHRWPAAVWSEAADELCERLARLPAPERKEWSDRSYRRDALANWVARLLDSACRSQEVVPLFEAEAALGGSAERLVRRLMEEARLEEAALRAREGIAATPADHEGTRRHLRTLLREIAERKGDREQAAAWRAGDFFRQPSLSSYLELTKAARSAGCGPVVKEAALQFLETGSVPHGALSVGGRGTWPLPPADSLPGASPLERTGRAPAAPHFDVLLELAFRERRPGDILYWYDRLRARKRSVDWGWQAPVDAVRVAEAVSETHPERSLEIWRNAAEAEIAQTSPAAYEKAAEHLKRCRALLERLGRGAEWATYLAGLREIHRRKRRLLEILDALEGRRRTILEG